MFVVAGVKVYRKFYTEAKEYAFGVFGIHVIRPVQKDPVDFLTEILNVSLIVFLTVSNLISARSTDFSRLLYHDLQLIE